MGDLIPLADYAAVRDAPAAPAPSPWFGPAPDWDPCHGCPVRGACREVRECQWGDAYAPDPEPALNLRLVDVEPPDIVA